MLRNTSFDTYHLSLVTQRHSFVPLRAMSGVRDARRERLTAGQHDFNQNERSKGWHTALYYFAEHVRVLTNGTVNHKVLYSYMGTKGHYINHSNPAIRKRTAAALSRLIHSSRSYVADFRSTYSENKQVFNIAAEDLCRHILACHDDADELLAYFAGPAWDDVEQGLENEWEDGRSDLNLARATNEMGSLLAWCTADARKPARERLTTVVSSYLHLLAMGHLSEDVMRWLFDETPLSLDAVGYEDCKGDACRQASYACLIHAHGDDPTKVHGWWVVDPKKPFVIGRYTDCDAIDTDKCVSRLHCRIEHCGGAWSVQDMKSTHGTRVERAGAVVYDNAAEEKERMRFPLQYGDCIVLAGRSRYWFGALFDAEETLRFALPEHMQGHSASTQVNK